MSSLGLPISPAAPRVAAPARGMLPEPPSLAHPMGIDNYGRDQLSRVIYGTRISLLALVVIVAGAFAIGLPIGLLAGFRGGGIDNLLMRVVDIMFAFP